MADASTEPVELIDIGDEVWAADPETGEAGAHAVTALIEGSGVKDLVTVSTRSGSVVATAGHPFWSVSEAAWVDAGDLAVGDAVLEADGTTGVVIAVSEVRRQATVHNLTVADLHTYFVVVGDAPTLVHNTSCPVNLASPSRTQHILDGDPRPGGGLAGGHRAGTGAGKSEFPAAWSDDMIMHNISDVATDPTLNWVQQTGRLGSEFTRNGDPVRFAVDGMRGGVMIRVVIEPRGVGIVTAFPIG